MHVDPSNVASELPVLDKMFTLFAHLEPYRLSEILKHDAASDPEIRSLLFDGVKRSNSATMSEDSVKEFSIELYKAMTDNRRRWFGELRRVTPSKRKELVADVFRKYEHE
jgi:hypothetical protein